jgi:hypothetical protein
MPAAQAKQLHIGMILRAVAYEMAVILVSMPVYPSR